MSALDSHVVTTVAAAAPAYPDEPPWHPHERYPEYPFGARDVAGPNPAYAAVRALFRAMRLDADRFGERDWNPLGEIVRPGDRVVLKPNWVQHFHESGGGLESVITHGSIVRAVLDYVWIALRGEGQVTVGDAPLQRADFERVLAWEGAEAVRSLYRDRLGFDVVLADFRRTRAEKDRRGLIVARESLRGDPRGYRAVDLAERSEHALNRLPSHLFRADYFGFRVTNYDPAAMLRHHAETVHEYLIAGSILDADVVIGLPKLKTHRKAGLTCALKNTVGVNGDKDWLPHHTVGSVAEGGDEYLHRSLRKRWLSRLNDRIESARSLAEKRAFYWLWRSISFTRRVRRYPDPFFEGSWYGNRTLCRTIIDLNRILAFADRDGRLADTPTRRLLYVVDAIVAGEGEGPLGPDPRPCGLVIGGTNAVAVDAACAALMGFDPMRIPLVASALAAAEPRLARFDPAEVRVESSLSGMRGPLCRLRSLDFRPPAAWRGMIERRVEAA